MRRTKKRQAYTGKDLLILVLLTVVICETALLALLLLKKARPSAEPEAPIVAVKKPKIAIVLDDWGYNLKNQQFLESVDFPITISVLPFLPYSKKIVEVASQGNVEVMLHLPLEPHYKAEIGLERYVVFVDMEYKRIQQIIDDAIRNLGGVSGVSNHMGSKATEDASTMEAVYRILKQKNLYFLDSRVTPDSICQDAAKKVGIKFTQRSVFLDNKANREYIQSQIDTLIAKAQKEGKAIGIGHDRVLTLEVIKECFQDLNNGDFELVFVSDLVE
ncbi:divergent polysaccharide deacetylase family protein [Candidatus Omnitrophota bacterium]